MTLLTVEVEVDVGAWFVFSSGGGEAALVVSGVLLGMFSGCLSPGSPAPTAERNQPLTRDWTGEESGVGDSEGNDVRLLSSAAGDGVRPNEVLEARLRGLTRPVPFLLPFDMCEFWDEVRTRSTAPKVSDAAISVETVDKDPHSAAGRGSYRRVGSCGVVRDARRGRIVRAWNVVHVEQYAS